MRGERVSRVRKPLLDRLFEAKLIIGGNNDALQLSFSVRLDREL